MKRFGIALFTVFSILFLVAVGVATMLLFGDADAETATPTAIPASATPTAPGIQPPATLTPGRTPTTPQPSRTPRPTTTPAPTALPASGVGAITTANASEIVELDTTQLEGAPDAQHAIRSFAWSPDGRVIAAPEPANNRVALIDVATLDADTLAEQDEPVRSVAFSPDGALLAVGSREIAVWDVETGEPVATLEGHTAPVLSLAFSPDGATILSTSADRSVRLWDAITGDQQRQLSLGVAGQTVAFSPDGAQIAAQGERIVQVWDATSGEEVVTLAHEALVSGIAFSPDGAQIATASFDGAVRVWNIASGEVATTLLPEDDSAQPLGLAYSLDGTVLAVGRATRDTLDLIDAQTAEVLAALEVGPFNSVVRFSPDSRQLAALSGERGETLTVWGLPE